MRIWHLESGERGERDGSNTTHGANDGGTSSDLDLRGGLGGVDTSGASRDVRSGNSRRAVSGARRLGVWHVSVAGGASRADCGVGRDNLGRDVGRVSRAVGDSLRARADGVGGSRVDSARHVVGRVSSLRLGRVAGAGLRGVADLGLSRVSDLSLGRVRLGGIATGLIVAGRLRSGGGAGLGEVGAELLDGSQSLLCCHVSKRG